MSATAVDRVGVVGGGIMGTGIAEVCARAGLDVILVEIDAAASARALERIEKSLAKGVAHEALDGAAAEAALARVDWADEVAAVGGCSLVIEAVVEDREAMLAIFEQLREHVVDPEAVLASNTSSMPIVELAAAAGDRGENVLGLHFFNPVPILSLVEIIPSLLTEERVVERSRGFIVEQLGKEPIVAADRAGFTVNALLIPYLLAAIRMFEQGLASAEDIDKGMVRGCAHPMGPLALADLIGLDTVMSVAETLYAEHREQLFAPPPLLQRLVSARMLGRKSKRGLYSYA